MAERLVGGEDVARDEIRIFLERVEATADELQSAVDRLTRRRELLATIRDAVAPRKRLADIEAEFAVAQAEVDRAAAAMDRLRQKYGTVVVDLGFKVADADKAAEALIEPANLPPPEADRLTAARQAAATALNDLEAKRRELPRLRGELADAEQALATERATLTMHRRDPGVIEQVTRAERRAKACGARLADAEAAIAQAERALTAARRHRDLVEADVRSRYGA